MSQVKKFQSGGSSPETKPYGVFRMNGRELDGKTAIARLTSIGNGLDLKQREAFSVAKRALEDGHTVSYDADKNLLSVKDKSGNEIFTNYTNTKARYDNSNWKKFWGAQFEDEADQFKRGLRNFALVGMDNPVDQITKPADNRTKLRKGSGWIDYDTDEKGNKTFRADGMRNLDILAQLKEMQAYYDDTDQSTLKDRYDTSAFGTSRNLEIFRNFYNNLSDENRANYWSGLESRIRNNTLTKGDIEALGLFGYTPSENTDEDSGGRRAPKLGDLDYIDPKWAGNIDALKNAGLGAYQKDGIWYLTGDSNNKYLSNYWYLGGIDLFNNTPWSTGFIGDNGRLYTDVEFDDAVNLSENLDNARNLWFGAKGLKDYNSRYDQRIASGIRFSGDRNGIANPDSYYGAFTEKFDPSTQYNREFYNYFAGKGNRTYDINYLNGQYSNLNGHSVIAYIPNSGYNRAGIDNVTYVSYDPSTNKYTEFVNELDLVNTLGLQRSKYTSNNTFGGSTWEKDRKNNEYAKVVEFGNVGQQNTIVTDRNGKLYIARKNGDSFINPVEIDQDVALDIINNPSKYNTYKYEDLKTKKAAIPKTVSLNMGYELPWHKNGGELPKLQFGGSVGKSITSTNYEDTNNIKTDITKAHALDGSDGGLTQNEWLQIGAAVGDLAGLGLTFAGPVGNIAGAAVGAGASTTKFIADIKQDGFQAKDLGNYAMNLALDAATIMPILGTGAKAAKAAKTIKSISKPLLRFLSVSGAAAPVITAVQRIANGEKYTSADLTQAIQGLGSAVIATKNIKDLIGDARLASRVADKKGLAVLEDAKKVVTKSVGENIKVDATKEQIAELVSKNTKKSDAIKAVQEQFKGIKDGNAVDLDEKQAEKLLSSFGVNIGKEKIGFSKDNKWYKAFIGKKEGNVNFEIEGTEPHSFARYLLDGRARAKAMRNADQVLTPEYINRVFDRVKFNNGRASLESQALMRASVDRPEWFGNTFMPFIRQSRGKYVPTRNISGIFLGGNRYYRPVIERPTMTMADATFTRSVADGLPEISNLRLAPINKGLSPEVLNRKRIAYTNWLANNPNADLADIEARMRFFRKGGKIGKYQVPYAPLPESRYYTTVSDAGGATTTGFYNNGGVSYSNYYLPFAYNVEGAPYRPTGQTTDAQANTTYTPNQHIWDQRGNQATSSTTKVATTGNVAVTNATSTTNTGTTPVTSSVSTTPKITRNTSDFGLAPINNNLSDILAQEQTRTLTPSKPNENLVGEAIKELQRKRTGEGGGGTTGNKLGFNWANIYDTGRALTAQAFANRAFDRYMDNFKDLKRRQFIAPQIDQVRYNDSDIQQGYQNATRPILEQKYVTNDGQNSLAYKLAQSQQLSNLENQRNVQISDRVIKTNEANRQVDAQNTAARVATANEKSHWLTNIASQEDLARANKINTDWANIWGPLTNQFGQQTRDAQNKLYDLELQQSLGTAQAAAQTQFVNEINKFRNDWLNDPNAGKYYSYEDWMEANHPTEYQLALTNMRNSIMGNTYSNQRLRFTQDGQALGYKRYKSGGKVSSKSNRRPYLEDIAINTSKQAQQNAAKMSDHLMRMLQQLMK